jgi:hypothetical protein
MLRGCRMSRRASRARRDGARFSAALISVVEKYGNYELRIATAKCYLQ